MRQAEEQAPGVPGALVGGGGGGGAGAGAGVSTFFFPHAVVSIAPLTRKITAHIRKLRIINVLLAVRIPRFMDRLLEATARAERDHFWFHGFRRFVQPLLVQATEGVQAPRILDCGCGTGHNLKMLRQFGRAWGIDITWSGLAYARDGGERGVARASAPACPFPPASSIWSPRSTCCMRSRTRSSEKRSMRCIGCCGPEDRS